MEINEAKMDHFPPIDCFFFRLFLGTGLSYSYDFFSFPPSLFFLRILLCLFLPKAPRYIVVYFYLWVLLVVACRMPPQHGLMSGAMSAPRIRTCKALGHRFGAHKLNHSAMGWTLLLNFNFTFEVNFSQT